MLTQALKACPLRKSRLWLASSQTLSRHYSSVNALLIPGEHTQLLRVFCMSLQHNSSSPCMNDLLRHTTSAQMRKPFVFCKCALCMSLQRKSSSPCMNVLLHDTTSAHTRKPFVFCKCAHCMSLPHKSSSPCMTYVFHHKCTYAQPVPFCESVLSIPHPALQIPVRAPVHVFILLLRLLLLLRLRLRLRLLLLLLFAIYYLLFAMAPWHPFKCEKQANKKHKQKETYQ